MTAPSCAACTRLQRVGRYDACFCNPKAPDALWDVSAARRKSGPCGPEGRRFLAIMADEIGNTPQPRRSFWQERRWGCLAMGAISLLFWGLLALLTIWRP